MRPGYDFQRAVFLSAIVEMNPDSEHVREHFDRRLNVKDAVFDCPGPKTGRFDFMLDGDSQS